MNKFTIFVAAVLAGASVGVFAQTLEGQLESGIPHRSIDAVELHATTNVGVDDIRRIEDVAARDLQREGLSDVVGRADVPKRPVGVVGADVDA